METATEIEPKTASQIVSDMTPTHEQVQGALDDLVAMGLVAEVEGEDGITGYQLTFVGEIVAELVLAGLL